MDDGLATTTVRFKRVLSFGRTGREQLHIFSLKASDVQSRSILDCGAGPGSLSHTLRRLGAEPTAVDPSYQLSDAELSEQTRLDIQYVAEQMQGDPLFHNNFDTASYLRAKHKALNEFLADKALHPHTYVAGALPRLPFCDESFDLSLCGSLLFSYSPHTDGGLMEGNALDLLWHTQAIAELLRVSRYEVRIYPAHTQWGNTAVLHPYIEPLLSSLPETWQGSTFLSAWDQGIKGSRQGLLLRRRA